MVIKILGERDTPAFKTAEALVKRMGYAVHNNSYLYCDLAIAPLLTKKLNNWELLEPIRGTLIFHPSPLPYGRGPSAIKWAFVRKQPITAATWIWANDQLDGGDICEMEILAIDHSMRPKDYYESHVLPALERTLQRCLIGISKGFERRVPQITEYVSYDAKYDNVK